jgi:lambda repressor-like predicted transcriptional regulator
MDLRKELQVRIEKSGISISKLSRIADVHDGTIRNFLNHLSEMTTENYQKCIMAVEKWEKNNG